VAWSYDLLTDDERELLRVTSVFAGGFELASIHAVATCGDVADVLGHLDSLVRKSLVVADHTTTHTRYRLFETIRQFAEERLEASAELAATRDRHAAYFAGRASAQWDTWNGPGWRDAVDWVDAELANLRAAFRSSSAQGEVAVATDIAAHAALMGFSVQLFETLGWAECLPRGTESTYYRERHWRRPRQRMSAVPSRSGPRGGLPEVAWVARCHDASYPANPHDDAPGTVAPSTAHVLDSPKHIPAPRPRNPSAPRLA